MNLQLDFIPRKFPTDKSFMEKFLQGLLRMVDPIDSADDTIPQFVAEILKKNKYTFTMAKCGAYTTFHIRNLLDLKHLHPSTFQYRALQVFDDSFIVGKVGKVEYRLNIADPNFKTKLLKLIDMPT